MKIDLQQIRDFTTRSILKQIVSVLIRLDGEKVEKRNVHQQHARLKHIVTQTTLDRGFISLKHEPIDYSVIAFKNGAFFDYQNYEIKNKKLIPNVTLTLGDDLRIQYSYI